MMKTIRVAVAVIKIADRVLIAKRAKHQHQGGLWEFPGGKIEGEESLESALRRECFEELDIIPQLIKALRHILYVIPAKAGICLSHIPLEIPAFAGMTRAL